MDEFQAEPVAFSSLKERGKQGMQFKSIWAQCPQGGEMNSLNQNTPVPAHPVCAPSWHSPRRAPCRSPHHGAGPPAPRHVLTTCPCPQRPCGCSASPGATAGCSQECGTEGAWADWALGVKSTSQIKKEEVADICLSGLPWCCFCLHVYFCFCLFVCSFSSPPH